MMPARIENENAVTGITAFYSDFGMMPDESVGAVNAILNHSARSVPNGSVQNKAPWFFHRQIKTGLEFVRQQYPQHPRPLPTLNFRTDGKYPLVGGMLGSKEKDREAFVNASRSGQLEMTAIIEGYLQLIGWDASGTPDTIFPKAGQRIISITSGIVSGRPAIEGTRTPTATIAQRFRAGETPQELAVDYGVTTEAIEAAIKYEEAA